MVLTFPCLFVMGPQTMVKTLLKKQGPLYHKDSLSDRHEIDPSYINPFPGEKIYIVICPSHQVRSIRLINCS